MKRSASSLVRTFFSTLSLIGYIAICQVLGRLYYILDIKIEACMWQSVLFMSGLEIDNTLILPFCITLTYLVYRASIFDLLENVLIYDLIKIYEVDSRVRVDFKRSSRHQRYVTHESITCFRVVCH